MNRISKMIAGIQQAKDGNYAVRLETSGRRDEMDLLTESINHLLDQVQESYAACEQTRETLRESQERYRRLEAGMVYTHKFDAGERHVFPYANERSRELFGVEPGDLRRDGSLLAGLIHPDDMERRDASIIQSMETLQPWRQELRHIVQGEVRWYDFISRPERLPDGDILSSGIILETTEHKRTEEKLSRKLRQMTLLHKIGHLISSSLSLEEVVHAIMKGIEDTLDPDLALIFLKCDDSLHLRVMGPEGSPFKLDSVPAHRVGDCLCGLAAQDGQPIYSSDISTDPRCNWQECKEAGLRSFAALPLKSGDRVLGVLGLASGSPRDFTQEARLLETLAAEISLGLGNFLLMDDATIRADQLAQEVCERQRIEEALRESEVRFRQVVEFSPLPIGIITGNVPEYVNPEFVETFGYTLEDLSDMAAWFRLAYPDPAYRQSVIERWQTAIEEAVAENRATEGLEVKVTCKDGSVRDVQVWSVLVNGKILAFCYDFTERKRVEEALEKRLVAFSRPLANAGELKFDDLFDLDDIQRIQDLFAKVTGVAALITTPDGTPITQPSNFSRLCRDIIRQSEIGARNCRVSDTHLGRYHPGGPIIHHCLSAGLCNAGASITVGGKHVANWLIGQVRDGTQDDESMREYARALGVDEEEFMAAFREVPLIAEEQFKLVAQAHFLLANQLSNMAYQNIQQARFISERQRAEKELRESEERLRLALKAANQGLWDLDIQSGEAQVTPEYATMLGYDPAGFKLNLDRWQEDLHPDDRERIMATYGAYIRGEIPEYAVEFRQRTASGDWKWILSLGKIVAWDDEGRPLRMLGTHTDISERKWAEEELRENERKYRSLYQEFQAILNAVPDILCLLSRDLRIVWGNEATILQTSGRQVTEIIGKHCYPLRHERSEPCENCPVVRCFSSGKVETEETVSFGDTYELCAVPLYDDHGELRGAIEVARNITERKRAEEELRENERKYRSLYQEFQAILNAIPDGLSLISPDFRIVWGNEATTFGKFRISETLGQHCYSLRHDRSEPCEDCAVARCFRSGKLETQEVTAFGGIWELYAVPLYDDEGELRGAIEVARDVTERKRAEEALRQVNETLRATLNAAPVAIIDLDNEGRVKSLWNPAAEQMLGWRRDEVLGHYLPTVPIDNQEEFAVFRDWVRSGKQILGKDVVRRRKDGSLIEYSIYAAPEYNVDRQVVGNIAVLVDITERKRGEEALKRSEVKYRRLHESMTDAFVRVDMAGRIREANRAYLEMLGYSEDELRHMTYRDLTPERWHAFEERIVAEQILVQAYSGVYEKEYRKKDGTVFPVEMRAFLLRDDAGQPIGMWAIVRDIIARKRVEEEIRQYRDHLENLVTERTAELSRAYQSLVENEARYRLLAENITDVIWTMGFNLQFTYLSPSVELLRGFTPQETMAQPLEEIFSPESLKTIRHVLGDELSREQQEAVDPAWFREFEVEIWCQDGSSIWVEVRTSIIRDLDLQAVGFLGVARDISRRRQAEEALRESEARFRTIFSHAPLGIVLWDLAGHMLEANPAALKILGYSFEEMSCSCPDFVHPDDYPRYQEFMEGLQRSNADYGEVELRAQRKDGTWAWERLHLSLVRKPGGEVQYFLGMIEDVSKLKQWEEEIRTYQERLRSLAIELTLTEERERRRLATNLHDNIGQVLALAQIKLGALADATTSSVSQSEMTEVRNLITQVIHTTRFLTFELGSPILYELGLEEAVEALAENYEHEYGLRITVRESPCPYPQRMLPACFCSGPFRNCSLTWSSMPRPKESGCLLKLEMIS